ncbi:dihydropyrimidinase [Falsiroseomonas sp.]|jgi:dihydropyrimidinase|uniref:dihydropyrimidinase n=1 Tax=Falsiroseomonas sp. TaxID=2870721 RepID=UPI003F6FA3A8
MSTYDIAIRGGQVATSFGVTRCDIGIKDGRIAAIAESITDAAQVIDAGGLLVLPGGVDSHCHIEETSRGGYTMSDGEPQVTVNEESFITASASAFAGGTTSVVCFIPQWKGFGVWERYVDARQRGETGMLDFAFHQIISDPTDVVMKEEVPRLVAEGVRSLKVFLTYEPLHLGDAEYIKVLLAAREHGCLVTVHCENFDAIGWRTRALLDAGMTAPQYHAWSRPRVVEREATHRAIALAELVDQPIQVFHVSCEDAAEEIARAQARGVKVWGETCPQYVTLTAADMARTNPKDGGFEGAKFMCSPAPRDTAEHGRIWEMIRRGTLDIVSSDHCGFSYEGDKGKGSAGRDASFEKIPNGIPGLAARLPIIFSEGVSKGRISIEKFVELTSTNPARLMGLYPKKGAIQPGADADLVLWDPKKKVTITNALMQHAIDYTPYEGLEVTGWPVSTIRRGEVVMRDGKVQAEPGTGRFLPRGPYDMVKPRGITPDGFGA